MKNQFSIIVMFSGGLDSILAAKVLEEQGLSVKCLHFVTPFFGHPQRVSYWQRTYGLDVDVIDVGEAFVAMLRHRPEHGFGKVLNPCVDCKILLLREARKLMAKYGASCIATGEVLGQRPMSQRSDTLNIIRRDAGVQEELLRPLSAKVLPPTPVEERGLVDRSRLLGITGRGRKEQLALAERYALKEIPTPAGGCRLTERENARRYWPVLSYSPAPDAQEFLLANEGRQFWCARGEQHYWLAIGRHQANNEALEKLCRPADVLLKVDSFPGPLAVGRCWESWPEDIVMEAAALMASYSPRAVASGQKVTVHVTRGEEQYHVEVMPSRKGEFRDCMSWLEAKEDIRAEARKRHGLI